MDDQTFAALANTHRREILLALLNRDAPAVDALEAASNDDTAPDVLRVSLHHTHLPKLEATDLIDWDGTTTRVERGPAFEVAEPILDVLAAEGDRMQLSR